MAQKQKKRQQAQSTAPASQPELVDPVWMLKAVAAVIVVAAVCAYIAICTLYWRGQWQIVLSPSRTVASSPSVVGLAFENIRFGPNASGQPELTGWWIPTAQQNDPTVLVMHGGSGTMSDTLRQARLLHDARLNVLLFDYRGFGKSSGAHPSEAQMERDTEAAFQYVTNLRHAPAASVIAFGEGLGASLATKLSGDHHEIGALILEDADGDFETRAALDTRSRIVPVSLLFRQKFPLADPLHSLATPKLLISYTKSGTPPVAFARAGDPKLTAEIASPDDTAAWTTTLRRFLDGYVARPPSMLQAPLPKP